MRLAFRRRPADRPQLDRRRSRRQGKSAGARWRSLVRRDASAVATPGAVACASAAAAFVSGGAPFALGDRAVALDVAAGGLPVAALLLGLIFLRAFVESKPVTPAPAAGKAGGRTLIPRAPAEWMAGSAADCADRFATAASADRDRSGLRQRIRAPQRHAGSHEQACATWRGPSVGNECAARLSLPFAHG